MTVIANPPYPSYFDVDGSPLEDGYIYFGAANQNPETNPITVYWDAAYTQPALQPIRTSGGFTYRAGTPANIYVSTDFSITVRDKNRRLVYSKLLSEGQTTAEVNLQYSTQSITATSGQTVFGLSTSYTPGNNSLAVYHNGSRLIVGSDYTETSATVITLAIGATAGDVLQFVTATPINPSSLGAAAVAYIPAGAGAVATNVQAKLRETVSVRDFGAAGDGVTDDTAAINSAIAYAKATSVIKCVYFPTGNYLITAPIDARGNFGTGLELWGARATITSTGNFPALRLNGRVPDTPPEVRMMAYVHGFVFQGPGKANTSSIGIEVQRGANVIVEDCQIYNFYQGLYCFGNLISSYSKIYVYGCAYGIDVAPDGIEFAPNDLHFKSCQVVNNTRAVRAINFPNGAMTFEGCELEGNNLTGNVADSIRVIEFFNAGKVTLNGCHVEANPGQVNIYFDGNNNAHLNVIGCEVIPGDSSGTVLYMANATGSPSLTVIGSRVTNNVQQIFLSSGVKAFLIGTFAGNLSGTLTNVTWLRDSRVVLGRIDPLAGGTGIIFPATQNPSSDPNTLDDYDEGTWTPTVIGTSTAGTATYANQAGKYTKIGRLVFVECYLNWSAGTGTGDLRIGGLPFAVSNVSPTYPCATIGRINNVTLTAGAVPQAYFEPGITQIVLNQSVSGGGALAAIPYDGSGLIMLSGTYTV